MSKTLVKAAHTGQGPNGKGGCFTRWSMVDGSCSGVSTAEWLNSLGDDDAPYGSVPGMTNGRVRENWLRGGGGQNHIVPASATISVQCPRCDGKGWVLAEEAAR